MVNSHQPENMTKSSITPSMRCKSMVNLQRLGRTECPVRGGICECHCWTSVLVRAGLVGGLGVRFGWVAWPRETTVRRLRIAVMPVVGSPPTRSRSASSPVRSRPVRFAGCRRGRRVRRPMRARSPGNAGHGELDDRERERAVP